MTTDPDTLKPNIVEEARKYCAELIEMDGGPSGHTDLINGLANEIESLRTRITGLEAMLCDAQAEVERLRASGEAARLQPALKDLVPLMDIADSALDKDTEEQIRKVYDYDPPNDGEIVIRADTYLKINKLFAYIEKHRAALQEDRT